MWTGASSMSYGGKICFNYTNLYTSSLLDYYGSCIPSAFTVCWVAAQGPTSTWTVDGTSFVWVNFAQVVGLVPECVWPRIYVYSYGGWSSTWNWTYGSLC